MFNEVYPYIEKGDYSAPPSFPTFEDRLRELVLNERIMEGSTTGSWTAVE